MSSGANQSSFSVATAAALLAAGGSLGYFCGKLAASRNQDGVSDMPSWSSCMSPFRRSSPEPSPPSTPVTRLQSPSGDLFEADADRVVNVRSSVSGTEDVIIIGIAGGTGSGKTTFANSVCEKLGKDNVCFITHDWYYKDLGHMTVEERAKVNFDHPDSLDTDQLVQDLRDLKSAVLLGNSAGPVYVPQYDFNTHTRRAEKKKLAPRKVIMVEGILIFSHPELFDMVDVKVFVDTDADIRFIRRLERDIEQRGRTPESVITQYQKTVRPMHLQFVEPAKYKCDIIIPFGFNQVALNMVTAQLGTFCNKKM